MPEPRNAHVYSFVSRWTLDAPREACWAVLADPELSWPRWWPGLRGRVLALTDDDVRRGSRAALAFRTPLGYRLRIELVAAHVEPPSGVRFDVSGDLAGVGVVTLAASGETGTNVTILWDVRTTRWWLNALGPVARPVFGWAHARVLRAGQRGLAAEVVRDPAVPRGAEPVGRGLGPRARRAGGR